MQQITSLIGFFIRSFKVLSNLVNEPQLIATFRIRAAVAHCALHNSIRCYPTESRAKCVTQIVDWKVWNVGFGKSRSPRPLDTSNWLVRIAWARKDIRASRPLFFSPFPQNFASQTT
jgi:hypothetical protein